jgi:Zn-dependent M28 family amino/carboxypeptidase
VRDEVVAWTKRAVPAVTLDRSELVFVGYGVEAPEQQWDDYKGIDLAGKTMVVLVGDPPVPDPEDPTRLDPRVFGGPAMTWYGRWVYKYDAGAARKAAGVLIVHETGPAGYPFSIVQGRLSEQFDLRAPDHNVGRPAVEGWITLDAARTLFAMAGQDFDALKRRAVSRDFRPVPLGLTASMTIGNALRPVDSRNVVARLAGSDPALRDEHVVLTAHWDHFGHGSPVNGETIRHGAVDNATGVAGLLETARLLSRATPRPRRPVLLLSVTAEEQGLLGSEYYVRHPLVPLEKTLAVLNFEMMNVYGRTRDLIVYGLGASDLDDRIREAAARQQRALRPDPVAEQGLFYRSDHFPFARAGVPATWVGGGDDYVGKPAGYAQRVREEWLTSRYHKPADRVWPDWDLAGAMEDLQVYAEVALEVANGARYPEWRPGAEFKAARDAMLTRTPAR